MGMRARWHECQRRESGTMHTEETRNGKNRRAFLSLTDQSVSQSISQSASKQAGKQAGKQAIRPSAHPCAPVLSSTKGPPLGRTASPVKSQAASPRKGVERDGRWRVEGAKGWRIEDRGSTNQLAGGPHLELDTKGSLTRSSKSTPSPCHVGIRRRGNEKGGGCGVGPLADRPTD